MDNVPYVTRRAALVTYETHQAFHVDYALEMRKRTDALIDAYLATAPEPLLRLRQELGVTHLLVDVAALERRSLGYFRPFDVTIREAASRERGEVFEVLRQTGPAGVFDDGRHVVLDLRRVRVGAAGAPR